jgi:hypothetical protein
MYKGLGNYALGQLAWSAQQHVRALASTHELDTQLGADAIHDAEGELDGDQTEPPVGLTKAETVEERMQRWGALYAICADSAKSLGGDEWSSPQSVASRLEWLAGQTKTAIARANTLKARGDLTQALAVASQANQEAKFWEANLKAIKAEMEFHASDINIDAYDVDELVANPAEMVNAVAAMYRGVLSECNKRKANRFYVANGPLGDQLRSDVGALEAELGALRLLDTDIQRRYSAELMEAINRGVNLKLIDDVEKQATAQLNAKLERELAKLGVA